MNATERWKAVCARDRTQDGRFFYGVGTTGIYCRPSCPARRPLRKNVRFYDSPAAAEGDGLRACRRCRPLELVGDARLVARMRELCRHIEAHADEPLHSRRTRAARRDEQLPPPAQLQGARRRVAEGLRRGVPARALQAGAACRQVGHRRDLRGRLRVEQPRLRAHRYAARHDAARSIASADAASRSRTPLRRRHSAR